MIFKTWFGLLLLTLSPLNSALAVQDERSFPLIPTGELGALGATELLPLPAEILELRGAGSTLTLTAVPLPGGSVTVELRRLHSDPGARVYVNGEERPGTADHGDLSIWKGTVRGREGSDVLLGFSGHGCHGWIHDGTTRWNLLSSAGPDGDWTTYTSRLVGEETIVAIGPITGPRCATESPSSPRLVEEIDAAGGNISMGVTTLECPIAVETDYQLFQRFGNLVAMQNYVTLLMTAVSDRMLEQADIILTYPYIGYYTDANDPWHGQDNGLGCGEVLTEFRNAWQGNIPNDAALGHFISGASLGCGVAWVGVVCNQSWGFSLSCCINGGVSFPVTQGSNTWDFFVVAHELGHNFGSLHTHDYCPPLDECSTNCNGTTACTNTGTNLSYCHGCAGGMNNITTYYHPTVVAEMRQHAESSCLGLYCTDIESYCWGAPNSSSALGSEIGWSGSTSISQNDFILVASGAVPNKVGLFFYGAGQTSALFGDGLRCVDGAGSSIYRLGPPAASDSFGIASRSVDFTISPAGSGPGQITPASTWNFQYWYRDPAGGLAGFNLSNALRVTFCP
ncbi:MAG: hypothetical protein ACI9F9_002191 [Candidatus Paceibacteria bacterium]|jgi:hypothetical protein